MPQCYVTSCTNSYSKTKGNAKVIYHMLPSVPEIAAKWSQLCGDKMLPPYARICSDHFTQDCYQRDLQHELLGLPLRKKLKSNAVPNHKLPVKNDARNMQERDQQYVKNRLNLLQGISLTIKEMSKDGTQKKKGKVTMQQENKDQITMIPLKRSRDGQIKTYQPNKVFNPGAISTPNGKVNVTKTGHINKNGDISDNVVTKSPQKSKSSENERNKDKKVCITPPKLIKPITCRKNKENFDKDICISENHTTKPKTAKREKDDRKKYTKNKNSKPQCMPTSQQQRTKSKEAQCLKNNKDFNLKMPMRSSIRIAKKKSIESMSDSFTSNVNSKKEKISKKERFSDKLKFMAKLELKYERNDSIIIDLDHFFNEFIAENEENEIRNESLNKMQIMEDVREGCNAEPSSPGHAEQRSSDDVEVKQETQLENGYEDVNHHERNDNTVSKDDIKKEEMQNSEEPTKTETSEDTYSNDGSPNSESNKRKLETEDYPIKRLRAEMHDNFASRDKILNEFIEMADCNSVEQIHTFSEQLLAEIKTLNELAKEKEREWNNLIHLKKLKEELLIRMQRKKQVILLSEKSEYVEMLNESQGENGEEKIKNNMPQSILKANLTGAQRGHLRGANNGMNGDKLREKIMMPKTQLSSFELNGGLDLRQAKQRPTLDVQSIIADYRQKHPETVPRRGRRIRTSYTDGISRLIGSYNLNYHHSMALGSDGQLRQGNQDVRSDLGMLLNTINMTKHQEAMKTNSNESQGQNSNQDAVSFKDMLLQFAKLSQSERNELIQNAIKPPPPYPEVTVHPVPTTTAAPTNSLLHGILTKTPPKQSKTSFSPTLARLLTAPERATNNNLSSTSTMGNNTTVHPSNMSISEILCTSKTRNEITITPVDTQYETPPAKGRLTEEEEAEDSADRLVIDESNEAAEARRAANSSQDTGSDGDEVPTCQGCNQKPAQFVCAGCGNQWYCSRDCQVSAWDEHSEVCSG